MAGLRNMRERLAEVVGTVRQSAESVSAASREISAGNHDLSARTEATGRSAAANGRVDGRNGRRRAPERLKAPAVPTSSLRKLPGGRNRVARW